MAAGTCGRSMLWLIAHPGAGCRHGEGMGVSGETWIHVGLVIAEREWKMGGLLTIVGSVAFELVKIEEESMRGGCCLCDADAGAV